MVSSMVEWLKHRAFDQHGLDSKPTRLLLLCPWPRHFMALFPVWLSWQPVLNFSLISIELKNQNKKFEPDSNIFKISGGVIVCPVYCASEKA